VADSGRISKSVHYRRKMRNDGAGHPVRIHKIVALAILGADCEVPRKLVRAVVDVQVALRIAQVVHPVPNAVPELSNIWYCEIASPRAARRELRVHVAEAVIEVVLRSAPAIRLRI